MLVAGVRATHVAVNVFVPFQGIQGCSAKGDGLKKMFTSIEYYAGRALSRTSRTGHGEYVRFLAPRLGQFRFDVCAQVSSREL